MHCKKALLTACALCALGASGAGVTFNGASALKYTGAAVGFGPRPPNSEANRKLQGYIRTQLKAYRCEVSGDAFTAQTPLGPMPMTNIIARFPGTSGRAVVITGHFDTKLMPGITFVGANDGGASTGLLLELARVLGSGGVPHKDDVYLVWFDGEEAIAQWTEKDGLHGSRHLAQKWASEGKLKSIKALINVDMIGDKDLGILQEYNSSKNLRDLVWQSAYELGLSKHFLPMGGPVEDDHMPFLRLGVNALDLIDFDYGQDNANWHTDRDTMDKLSANSLEVVGRVLVEALKKLEKQ